MGEVCRVEMTNGFVQGSRHKPSDWTISSKSNSQVIHGSNLRSPETVIGINVFCISVRTNRFALGTRDLRSRCSQQCYVVEIPIYVQ